MLNKLNILLVILLLVVSKQVCAKNDNINEFTLDNGLQVVVIENHKAPIVKQMLFYKVGAADEKIGKGGIAHLLEHLMFRGTKKIKGQEFNRIMEKHGAESNAFTAQDVTVYHQFADISRLELVMFLEADRMQNLLIGEDDFVTERDIVFQERKQRVDNNPVAKFFETVTKTLWQNHPYANPITGQDDEIVGLQRDDAVKFYKNYYAPNNAVLVLSGDVDMAMAKDLVHKYYGELKPVEFLKSDFGILNSSYKAKVEMRLPDVRMGRVVKMFAVPSLIQDKNRAFALEILGEYLGGSENSPFYQKLVIKDKKALGVDAYYDGVVRSYGRFVLSFVPADEKNDIFDRDIEKAWNYAIKLFDVEKLKAIKQKLKAELVYLQDNPESLAQNIGWLIAIGGNLTDWYDFVDNIEKVSVEDVKNAANYVWNNTPMVTGILRPEDKADE